MENIVYRHLRRDAGSAPAAALPRLIDVDRAKGLAILLVVFGHLVLSSKIPDGHAWYAWAKRAVYAFHMPFFMYLSGVVFFHTNGHKIVSTGYAAFVLRRAERLLVPFFLFGVLVVFGKYVASSLIDVDDSPRSLLDGLRHLIFDTGSSPALFIWYIYVLFIFCAITPLLWTLAGGRLLASLVVAVVLFCIPMGTDFYLDQIRKHYIFFVIGGFVAIHRETAMMLFRRFFPVAATCFVASFSVLLIDSLGDFQKLIVGTLSIPVLHQLVRLPAMERDRILAFFGAYSFVIYLFNTICIGVAKPLLATIAPFKGAFVPPIILLLFLAGAIGPIVIKKLLLERWPLADRLTS